MSQQVSQQGEPNDFEREHLSYPAGPRCWPDCPHVRFRYDTPITGQQGERPKLPEPAGTIYRLTIKLRDDLAFAAPEVATLHMERRLAEAYEAGAAELDVERLIDTAKGLPLDGTTEDERRGWVAAIEAIRRAARLASTEADQATPPHPFTSAPCLDCDELVDDHRRGRTHNRCSICGVSDLWIDDHNRRSTEADQAETPDAS